MRKTQEWFHHLKLDLVAEKEKVEEIIKELQETKTSLQGMAEKLHHSSSGLVSEQDKLQEIIKALEQTKKVLQRKEEELTTSHE